jgi:hypothetical protein
LAWQRVDNPKAALGLKGFCFEWKKGVHLDAAKNFKKAR